MIGTFGAWGETPHASLVRHPYVDITRAPDDTTEQRMYDTFVDVQRERGWTRLTNGRKRAIQPRTDEPHVE